jgi:hypothetical protein
LCTVWEGTLRIAHPGIHECCRSGVAIVARLITDCVSLSILLNFLELLLNAAADLPPRSCSYPDWVAGQLRYAAEIRLRNEPASTRSGLGRLRYVIFGDDRLAPAALLDWAARNRSTRSTW